MKILIVNDFKEHVGGTEMYIENITIALKKMGHTVKLFSGDLSYKQSKNVPKYLKLLNLIFDFHYYFKFRQIVNDFKPDIVHIHNVLFELSPSFLYKLKIPAIMTIHDNLIVNAVVFPASRTGKMCKKRTCPGCSNCVGILGAIYEFVKRKVHRILFRKILLFITPSKYLGDLVQEACFKPVEHIPNGFTLFPSSPLKNYDKLLYVGRLSSEKGVEYLLKAMPSVLKSHPTAKLTIVGDGPEKQNLISLTKELEIEKNVIFIPKVDHADLEKYYIDTTLVIVPSIYDDNLPTVCIEAMSVGRPIIGTNKGGIPELIDNHKTGLIVSSQNEAEIAMAITLLLKDTSRLNLMAKSSSEKAQKYAINTHIKNLLNIYNEVTKKV